MNEVKSHQISCIPPRGGHWASNFLVTSKILPVDAYQTQRPSGAFQIVFIIKLKPVHNLCVQYAPHRQLASPYRNLASPRKENVLVMINIEWMVI